ncbi:hypothetical protein TTHERM_000019724 (macronuclear) [Tetrahymena thermophila SB210]|uniref:Uncharacterized protein n=1 Tax=Tetrahymena thermophila (strain SB210) TaxID=312017 RepID=W7XF13_TETTS|nr:hypothetical protein TTHERM_000019724 [Tetrahymena thermophila SB210]EWS76387.1 hypothetical protein TTHERM_000019724 [Tetrahymena thermophila SB210]|eukprot:XP_012651171.1 hypothetical protein TTHERM_000019724 [Tetrahymena thermophila SB210]
MQIFFYNLIYHNSVICNLILHLNHIYLLKWHNKLVLLYQNVKISQLSNLSYGKHIYFSYIIKILEKQTIKQVKNQKFIFFKYIQL